MKIARLPEIAEIIMGQSPPGYTYNEVGDGLPFFQGKAEFGQTSPSIKKWCDAPKKIAESGDILMSVRAPVGPTNIASERCCIGRGLAAIRANSNVLDPGFLRFFLRHEEPRLARMGQGSTFAAIGRAEIASLELRLPPLPEQRRIVDILSRAEGIVRLRREAEKKAAEIIPALFLDMFGDPATNPKGWEIVTIGDLVHAAQDGPHVSPRYVDDGIPFISTRHVKRGQVVFKDLKFLSHEEAERQWKKCKPAKGDILYTKGGTTGIAAEIDFDEEIAVWVHVALLKTNQEIVIPTWLESMLNSNYCYRQSQELTHGIANRDLGLTRMVRIQAYLPPLKLQKQFGSSAKDVKSIIAQQGAALQKAEAFFDALLARVFSPAYVGDIAA